MSYFCSFAEQTSANFGGAIVAACRAPAGPSHILLPGALDGRGPDRVIVLSFVFVLAEYEDIQQRDRLLNVLDIQASTSTLHRLLEH